MPTWEKFFFWNIELDTVKGAMVLISSSSMVLGKLFWEKTKIKSMVSLKKKLIECVLA